VLDIAVNTFCVMAKATKADLGVAGELFYGFLRIDPLESEYQDGTIPASSGYSKDSPLHAPCTVACFPIELHVSVPGFEYTWVA
jgi:hypothetical protein